MERIKKFVDTVLIYYSQNDECWIAHSLKTDQVGTGVDMDRALAHLIKVVDGLLELARQDKTIRYLCDAPKEILSVAFPQ